ncbi:MAG: 50S ribosomal protein L21 [Candidatus Eiseniibacteriota bacterium]
MYAIITIAGKQWHAEPNAVLDVPLLEAEPGSKITFDQVHLLADAGKVTLGKPFIGSAKVQATVLEHARGPKLVVGKFKRRKAYRRKKGHRQDYTRIQIDSITA